jgi:tripartite ATP-independent transporter DctP family solute receptor
MPAVPAGDFRVFTLLKESVVMKKFVPVIALVVLAGVSAFARGGESYSLRIGNVLSDTDPITIGLREMAKAVDARTSGKVKIQVYPSSQLGDTADVLEQAKSGSAVGIIIDTGMLADYVPAMAIYTAPYVFDNVREARKFVETPMFAEWDEQLASHGLRDLSCNWYQGARHFLTNIRVEKPADLANLRIRTMGSKVAQESMRAFGAVPTSLAWSEVYSGLQAGVLDAAEAQLPAVYGASLHEVIKFVAESGHFILNTALVISEKWYSSLPQDYRNILREESLKAGDYATSLTIQKEGEIKADMQKAGVTFVAVDIKPFIQAGLAVYDVMGWTDLKKRIDQALGK